MTTTAAIPARRAVPELEHAVSRWRVWFGYVHVSLPIWFGQLVGIAISGFVKGDVEDTLDTWFVPALVAPPALLAVIGLGVAFIGNWKRCLWVSRGVLHAGAYGQANPRKQVALVDEIDLDDRRWHDPLMRFCGMRAVRHAEGPPLWIPVAWISRDDLEVFLDEARRVSPRITSR